MSIGDKVGTFFFGAILLGASLPAYLVAVIGLASLKYTSEEQKKERSAALNRRVIRATQFGWRFAIATCFWIRVDADGLDVMRAKMGQTGKPCIFCTNHTSFLDTILAVCLLPASQVTKVKMFVSSHILKLPVFGKICEAMGHLSVPFKNTTDINSMELDKEVMAERQLVLEEHVRSGGIGGWFPEGRINPADPLQVGQFRAGGMTIAVRLDVEMWLMAFVGNTVCWPRKAALGGRPARIGVKVYCLCESTHQFLETHGSDEKAKSIYLADKSQQQVQIGIDQLVKEGFVGRRGQDAGDSEKKAQ